MYSEEPRIDPCKRIFGFLKYIAQVFEGKFKGGDRFNIYRVVGRAQNGNLFSF